MIALSAGDWAAEVLPGLGGSIGRLDWRGQPVFRPSPERPSDPLETGCFPLVPYANRIARGRFRWSGREIDLGPTPGFEPHALHGQAWRAPWTVVDRDARSVRLNLGMVAALWPWAWRAEQVIRLDEDGLRIDLSLTNADETPMPGGLGLHPYFATGALDRVRLTAPSVWIGESLIPERLVPAAAVTDWSGGVARGSAPFVDNAYEGWAGVAEIIGADRTIHLSSPASRLHVYAPVAHAFIALEPVTHRPDALNGGSGEPDGPTVLAPGETMSLSLRVTAKDGSGALAEVRP